MVAAVEEQTYALPVHEVVKTVVLMPGDSDEVDRQKRDGKFCVYPSHCEIPALSPGFFALEREELDQAVILERMAMPYLFKELLYMIAYYNGLPRAQEAGISDTILRTILFNAAQQQIVTHEETLSRMASTSGSSTMVKFSSFPQDLRTELITLQNFQSRLFEKVPNGPLG